ncbi:MAG: glycoside hydrolase family 2 [Firmicutes bacterium]|nr:glycoside hydrolase family 2 [Bacillota bacterium]
MKLKHTKCYIKNYPRPQFVRPDWLDLNGEWDFAFDDANIGERKSWYKRFETVGSAKRKITVPFSYLSPKSGIGDETRHDNVWYSRVIDIPKTKLALGQAVILNFEGCDYVTKVWVGGEFVGSHKGGYTRFSFDITRYLKTGKNVITVKAEDSFAADRPRGKQRWQPENFGCWYQETTGIHKPVWIEYVSVVRLSEVEIVPNFDDLSVDFCFAAEGVGSLDASVEVDIEFNGKLIAKASTLLSSSRTRLTVALNSDNMEWETELWSPNAPRLYDIVFRLKDKGGKVTDTVGSYFGLRKLECKNGGLWLNNGPLYLKMLLDQGYWSDGHLTPPDEEALETDVRLTLEGGFNGIRKHQKIEDERFYYYCDIMGLVVWCEMPSHFSYNQNAVTSVIEEWSKVVIQMRNHPSILTWVPFNESWGIKNVASDIFQQDFTESVYYLTKTLDGERRPVISNDGWEHTRSDIITIHNYCEFGDGIDYAYGDMDKTLSDSFTLGGVPRAVFADGYEYRGEPVIISEFGGIAYAKDKEKGWGYGNTVSDQKAYLERLESLVDAIKKLPYVCGYCLTQTTDVMQEVNGVFDMKRNPKAPLKDIKKINDDK